MALNVNTNLNAYTALNNLQGNQTTLQVSVARLSSGLRIVTAADDPAGLCISQKYAAQVGGLGQAISNSKEAISMVQTTEGALNQVNILLQTMRNLAVHAANTAVSDATSTVGDQQQVSSSLQQINRIAETTQYGSKVILNGSAGTSASTANAQATFIKGSAATVSGSYDLKITQPAVQGAVQGAPLTTTALSGAATVGIPSTAPSTLTFWGNAVNDNAATGLIVDIASGSDPASVVNQVNQNPAAQAAGITASIDGGNHMVFTSSHVSTGSATSTDLGVTVGGAGGLATTTGVTGSAIGALNGADTFTTYPATGASLMNSEILTFSNASNSVNVKIPNGASIAAGVAQINEALHNAGIDMTAGFDAANQTFTLSNADYGSGTTVVNSFNSNPTGTATSNMAINAGASYNVAASGLPNSTTGQDVQGTFTDSTGNVYAASGKGQLLTGAGGTAVDNLQLLVTTTVAQFNAAQVGGVDDLGPVIVSNNSLQFQVGAFASQTVGLDVGSMSTSALGTTARGTTRMTQVNLANIDVTSGEGARDALKVIDAAIDQVSSLRADLGSFQTLVLQSNVNNLTTAEQNMRASQSNIQDANFGQEMLTYSRGQIINQTSMSVLTQANQNAQQVLKLFQ